MITLNCDIHEYEGEAKVILNFFNEGWHAIMNSSDTCALLKPCTITVLLLTTELL